MVSDPDTHNSTKIIYLLNTLTFLFTYLIRSVKDTMGMSCSVASFFIYGSEAIDPSSWSRIAERTDTGRKPANIIRSTEASVWPALLKTPPSLYLRGNTWPGLLKSSGLASREASVRTVMALSEAETPVDVPDFASCNQQEYKSWNTFENHIIFVFCKTGPGPDTVKKWNIGL